jgi:DNA-binding NarL/FixJ family response regulator
MCPAVLSICGVMRGLALQPPSKSTARPAVGAGHVIHLSHAAPRAEEGILREQALSRIFVAERDSMTADLLASALERECGCRASTVRPDDLISVLAAGDASLVVISSEFHDEGVDGFELTKSVARNYPTVLVVIILSRSTPASVIHAFRSGARGVVTREQPVNLFLSCIEHVRKGYVWAGGREAEFLLEGIRSIPSSDLAVADSGARLTDREMQVVQCAAAGKTNKGIAAELRLSEHTVKNYLFRSFEKLGVSSRIELLFYLTLRGHKLAPAKVVELDPKSETRECG